jgi:uncharacterized membrane protein
MEYLHAVASAVAQLVRENRHWMGWNTFLALVPLGLALLLLWRPHKRTVLWWMGIAAFALFLPNAPYVITDLIHLRWMSAEASSGAVVVFGVLPLFAAFIGIGYTSYLICLELIVREVRTVRPLAPRWAIELPVHLLCSVGIVLGRITRLNTWDTVTTPRWTAERIFNTLTWQGAPLAVMAVFVAVLITTTVLRVLWDATRRWWRRITGADPAPMGRIPI